MGPAKTIQQAADSIPQGFRETIAAREYHISCDQASNRLQSPNRKHNLRAFYRPGNLTIQNRIDSSGQNFSLVLKNEGILADGRLIDRPDPAAEPEMLGNRLLIRHSKFTEEFTNNEDGVRQNFIIRQAPAGARELTVKLAAQGLRIQNGAENELLLFSKNDKTNPRLIYRDLKCWDAQNRPLAAHLTGSGQQILLTVDVRGATYPVTIDPIVVNGGAGNADALLESDQADAWLGFSVASAGDVNGDGYSDVLAGAPYYDQGENNEGAAFLYYGSANGLAPLPSLLEGDQAGAAMGYSVSSAGDINGDGFSDIAIGAPQYDNGQNDEGAVFVHLGSAKGIKPNPAAVLERNQPEAHFGTSLALAGDINADGLSDLLAGASDFDQGQLDEGVAFVFYGSKTGINPNQAMVLEINQPMAKMGSSVAGAGDVNADGFNDVLVGAPFYDQGEADEGGAFLYLGSAQGLTNTPAVIQGNQPGAHMGSVLAGAGDLNGDGYSDMIIGAPHYDKLFPDQGLVGIHFGSAAGIGTSFEMTGSQMEENFGRSVACAGDVNGDGFSDVLVGSYAFDHGQKDEGSVFVWYGTATGTNTYSQELNGYEDYCSFGQSVANAGDVNGDGFSDIIVGASGFDSGQPNSGAAYIYYGALQGINVNTVTKIEHVTGSHLLGYSVAGAGDVNGDGYDDVIIGDMSYFVGWDPQKGLIEGAALVYYGSPQGINQNTFSVIKNNQTASSFGWAVSSAGDVNGDGFDDVLVGDPNYDKQYDDGAVFVYHGSEQGVNTTAAITLEGSQAAAELGFSLAPAGDINGDGFGDIVVGAAFYSNSQDAEGAAFVFHGSISGINSTATILENNVSQAWMGYSVSGAGDLNGDGFSDIVIGCPTSQAGEGTVLTYYGSSNSINNNSLKATLAIGQPSYFGNAVSTAGDYNGDGYGDLIIGAVNYSPTNTGAAFMFLGSSNGISPQTPIKFESNVANSEMGTSVSYAGDVNGDGYSDILVGALSYNSKGSALLFKGNNRDGQQNNLRLYNSDLSTPINHTQFPQPNFGASLFAKSFTGRNKGKLVWETKPANQGFSKGSNNRITNSTQSTGSQNAYSNLGTTGIELKNVIDKQGAGTKVRVRVKYDPVLALTGQSYGPWRYLPAYLMGNSTAPVPEEAEERVSENMRPENRQVKREARAEPVTVYPNPVADRLDIDLKDKDQVQSLRIHTANGSVVYQARGLQSWVDVSKFPQGAYFLTITKIDGSVTTRKILIRR